MRTHTPREVLLSGLSLADFILVIFALIDMSLFT